MKLRILSLFLIFSAVAIAQTPPKSSATFTQVVSASNITTPTAPTKAKISVFSVSNPAPANGAVNLYVMVEGMPGGPIPSGTVTISGNGQSETVPLGLDGVVECTEYGAPAGKYGLLFTFNSANPQIYY